MDKFKSLRNMTCQSECTGRVFCSDRTILCAVQKLQEPKRPKKRDKRTHPCRLGCRVDIDTDLAFRAIAYGKGLTVDGLLKDLVGKKVKRERRRGTV